MNDIGKAVIMYPSLAQERRFVLRLYEYWMTLRGDREMPAHRDVDFAAMGEDADYCVMLTIAGDHGTVVLSSIGRQLRPDGWRDVTGGLLADCPAGEALATIGQHLKQTLERRAPVSHGGHFTVRGTEVLGRAILVPLSDDGVTITHVLAGANFKDAIDDDAAAAQKAVGL